MMSQEHARILVVDDEPDLCWALENAFHTEGHTVDTATTGTQALALLGKTTYNVVFVDAKLPDLDGLELAGLIRQHNPRVAIVLFSGYFYREDNAITEGLESGLFASFIAKPFDLKECRHVVRQALEANRSDMP